MIDIATLYSSVCGVYMIRNTANGKVYIGSSNNIKNRFSSHKSKFRKNKHNNKYLQKSWNKYGEDSFEFSVIEICEEDVIISRENSWINHYKSTDRDHGYNLVFADKRYIAPSKMKGKKLSKQVKDKMSAAQMGNTHNLGKERSEEYKQKISGVNNPFFGKKHSEEFKKKLSDARKGKSLSKEHSQNITDGLIGRRHSEETKQKMRDSSKKYWDKIKEDRILILPIKEII